MADIKGRKCATDEDWNRLSLEKKVEVLAEWSVYITEWAEKIHFWQTRMDGAVKAMCEVLDSLKVKMNGGGPPPKHPLDPHC